MFYFLHNGNNVSLTFFYYQIQRSDTCLLILFSLILFDAFTSYCKMTKRFISLKQTNCICFFR